jgi:hypothetical protein
MAITVLISAFSFTAGQHYVTFPFHGPEVKGSINTSMRYPVKPIYPYMQLSESGSPIFDGLYSCRGSLPVIFFQIPA